MTAVEWLVNQLKESIGLKDMQVIKQAKEMEKQQIIYAYKHELDNSLGAKILAEQYYNETFNKK